MYSSKDMHAASRLFAWSMELLAFAIHYMVQVTIQTNLLAELKHLQVACLQLLIRVKCTMVNVHVGPST